MYRHALSSGWPRHFQEQTGKCAQCPAQWTRKNTRHHCHFCSSTKPGTWLANSGAWLKPIYRRTKQQFPSCSGSSLFHFLVPLSMVSDPFPVYVLPPASVAISAYVVMRGRLQRIQISKPESTLCFSRSVKLPWDSSSASRKGQMMRKSMLVAIAGKKTDQQNQSSVRRLTRRRSHTSNLGPMAHCPWHQGPCPSLPCPHEGSEGYSGQSRAIR